VTARTRAALSIANIDLVNDGHTSVLAKFGAAWVTGQVVIPPTFDRIMAYPEIPEATADSLDNARMPIKVMMPGAERVPNDFVFLMRSNTAFIESFLAGMNTEINRELLWRGFPTDQRGTPFRVFWQHLSRPDTRDITPMHTWQWNKPVGSASSGQEVDDTILLIRGELFRRYPTTAVYAVARSPDAWDLKDLESNNHIVPVFHGSVGADVVFFGFSISPEEVDKYWFVLEEQMTEPHLGFDEEDPRNPAPDHPGRWKDVAWNQINLTDGPFLKLASLRTGSVEALANAAGSEVPADAHAGYFARALLQQPFRAAFRGDRLKP
jgi:hypothetical protein